MIAIDRVAQIGEVKVESSSEKVKSLDLCADNWVHKEMGRLLSFQTHLIRPHSQDRRQHAHSDGF